MHTWNSNYDTVVTPLTSKPNLFTTWTIWNLINLYHCKTDALQNILAGQRSTRSVWNVEWEHVRCRCIWCISPSVITEKGKSVYCSVWGFLWRGFLSDDSIMFRSVLICAVLLVSCKALRLPTNSPSRLQQMCVARMVIPVVTNCKNWRENRMSRWHVSELLIWTSAPVKARGWCLEILVRKTPETIKVRGGNISHQYHRKWHHRMSKYC